MNAPSPKAAKLLQHDSSSSEASVDSIARQKTVSEFLIAIRMPLLAIVHLLIFSAAYWTAFNLRFDFQVPYIWSEVFWQTLPWLLTIQMSCFFLFGTFNGWWRYITFRDLINLSHPLIISFLIFASVDLIAADWHVPRSIHLTNLVLAGLFVGGLRSVWRVSKEGVWSKRLPEGCEPAFIISNNSDSAILAHQINNRSTRIRVVGILSDKDSIGVERAGMRVVGRPADAAAAARKHSVSQVLVVAGDVNGKQIKKLKDLYDQHKLSLKVIPETIDLESGNGRIPLREININDLLQRDPVELDTELVGREIKGRCVLVTGAGGSIGSELCRQIIQFEPSRMVLVDHRENSVFMIHNELSRLSNGETELEPAVGDILDVPRMKVLFEDFQPEFVYHAAAHKHVGLMEINSGEAIKNNVLGTRRIAELADEFGVQKFVLISTDKAVNPTSVMGCTKQMAERFILSLAEEASTSFVVVRFGNVLGSNGSVVPLFKEQIARGGPVTLTDRRMTRFFMTIPEASQLVLQAACMGNGGEIFVLDMGEQILISELARQLIKLSGLPENSIEIKEVGIRRGEKLYEELHIDIDQLMKTGHSKINAAFQASEPLPEISEQIDELVTLAYRSSAVIRQRFKKLIPEYVDNYQQDGAEINNPSEDPELQLTPASEDSDSISIN